MKWDWITENWANHQFFDLSGLLQLSGEARNSVLKQLNRWTHSGKIIRLKRGYYTVSPKFRRKSVSVPGLANVIYTPSYLSSFWALGYYGIIPEKVTVYTSITSRTTRTFKNSLGTFRYQHVKEKLFRHYLNVSIENELCMLAKPEKALLDFLYLNPDSWTRDRLNELRLQNLDLLEPTLLLKWAKEFPLRIQKAIPLILDMKELTEKDIEL